MLEFLKVIFLGIVEGITEWLPISSTGHMILVDEFIKLNVTHDFMEMFLVVIQLGASSSPRSPLIWRIPELQSTISTPIRSPTVSRRSPAVSLPFKAL